MLKEGVKDSDTKKTPPRNGYMLIRYFEKQALITFKGRFIPELTFNLFRLNELNRKYRL